MKIARFLLRLYPRAFRERYEEEMRALLERCPPSFADTLHLLAGVCDAYLHPHLDMAWSERRTHMFLPLRRSVLTIFCAYVGMILAGTAFQKLSEYDDVQEIARTDSVVGLSFTLVLAAVVAFLAVLAGGLPVALAVVRSAFARKSSGSLCLLAVPLLACARRVPGSDASTESRRSVGGAVGCRIDRAPGTLLWKLFPGSHYQPGRALPGGDP
jgi:uncharacterized membrane protein YidH (DUF202 family)